jgi:hypothetical protein
MKVYKNGRAMIKEAEIQFLRYSYFIILSNKEQRACARMRCSA